MATPIAERTPTASRVGAYRIVAGVVGTAPLGVSLLLAAIAMVPVMAYALTQAELRRTAHDIHAQNHHYSAMAVSALIVLMTAVAASLRTRGWRPTAWGLALALVVRITPDPET